jgi:hypothetical protein
MEGENSTGLQETPSTQWQDRRLPHDNAPERAMHTTIKQGL